MAETSGLVERRYGNFLEGAFPDHPESNLQGLLRGQQSVLNELDAELLTVIASHQPDHAEGLDLTFTADIFGTLGQRRGRGDAAYRRYIKSIVDAYTGNGTRQGIRFAVGAGILANPDEAVHINEDFENRTYTIRVTEWADHIVGDVWDLADLSDPSCVRQTELIYDLGEQPIVIAPEEATESTSVNESPPAEIVIDPSETETDPDADRGFGSDKLDGGDTLGG